MALADEIAEQPAVAAQLLNRRPEIAAIADRLRGNFDRVVLVGRGSSGNAAIFGQYLFATRLRTPASVAAPSVVTLCGSIAARRGDLVIAISQSGASPDVARFVESARESGASTLAVTNDGASPLAQAAELAFELGAGNELAVAATKTYTASLLALVLLADELCCEAGDFSGLPALLEEALRTRERVAHLAADYAWMDRCAVVGRGYGYATAKEWALKLQELAQVAAIPFSAADFRHGPIALLERGFPLLAISSDDAAGADVDDLVREAHPIPGFTVLELSAEARFWPRSLTYPKSQPKLDPITSVIPAQWFAVALAERRGLDPDAPRGLAKVTRTT